MRGASDTKQCTVGTRRPLLQELSCTTISILEYYHFYFVFLETIFIAAAQLPCPVITSLQSATRIPKLVEEGCFRSDRSITPRPQFIISLFASSSSVSTP